MRKTKFWLSLILLTLLIPAVWLNTRTGVTIQDQFLFRLSSCQYRSLSGWSIVYNPTESAFCATLGEQTLRASMEQDGSFLRFTFDDGTISEGRWDSLFGLLDSNGAPVSFSDDIEIIVGDDTSRFSLTPGTIARTFGQIAMDGAEPFGSIAVVLAGLLVYLLGAAQFLWPEKMFFLFSRWRYQHAELSDDGIMAEKIGAILIMLCAIVILFTPLFA